MSIIDFQNKQIQKLTLPHITSVNTINQSIDPISNEGTCVYSPQDNKMYFSNGTAWITDLGLPDELTVVAPTTATDSQVLNISAGTIKAQFATTGLPGVLSSGVQNISGVKTWLDEMIAPRYRCNDTNIRIGNGVLNDPAATLSCAIGNSSQGSSTGQQNTSLGNNSLQFLTTGIYNNCIGVSSGNEITTGTRNCLFGVNTNGGNTSSVCAFGTDCLSANTASYLCAYGGSSLKSNTSGTANCAFGYTSMFSNITGSNNSSFGYSSMSQNLGSDNTAFGSQSLKDNISGNSNTCVGAYAGTNNLADANTCVGAYALLSNTTGISNDAYGFESLYSNTTGNQNTAVGFRALKLNLTGGNNVAIGSYVLEKSLSNNNTAIGHVSGQNLTTGNSNVFVGTQAGQSITTGSNNILIGVGVTGSAAALSNAIEIGLSQTTCNIKGIRGVTTATAAINVLVSTTGQLGTVSSRRELKENISLIDETYNHNVVMGLRANRFSMKSDESHLLTYGLIVDEVAEVEPDLVALDMDGNQETVYYNSIPILLLAEIQRLNKIIDGLSARILLLENK